MPSRLKRLFLSFSVNGDRPGRDFVRRLLDRLAQQDIEPWIFESPRGAITTGSSITDACRDKIDGADIFVVLVSDQALESDYVDIEVSHALWAARERGLPIVPLIATLTLRSEWSPALREAAGFKGITLPPRPLDAIEPIVVEICGRLGVPYVAPQPNVPRLPLRRRLADELQDRASLSRYPVGDFIAILQKCDVAARAVAAEDFSRARRILESVITDLELIYAITDCYYIRVVLGVVLLANAQAGGQPIEDVHRYFAGLIDEHHPLLDANAFVGRANALMLMDRYADALRDYLTAERYLENADAALFYNIVRARADGGLDIDPDDLRRRRAALEDGLATRVPGELNRLMSSIALAYAYIGDAAAAIGAWNDVGDYQDVFPEIVADVAHQLQRHARQRGSRDLIDAALGITADYIDCRGDLPSVALLQVRQLDARIRFDRGRRGDRARARQQLDVLLAEFPSAPVLSVDAAMLALDEGDVAAARSLCEHVVSLRDASECFPRVSNFDFNLAIGQAFWLLGRRPEAAESFRRSGHDGRAWYGTTLSAHFGLCAVAPPATLTRR